jgi:hypothetical protein
MVHTGPIRGDFPSLKLGRMVRYNSTIERDLLYFLEYWRNVTWYREQPMTIKYAMPDGQIRRYTPDYEIHEGMVKTLVECKPEARVESKHTQKQRQIGQLWAEENGYCFVTFTDTELRSGYQLSNLKLLWRYARQQDTQLQQQIVAQAKQAVTCSVDELCQRLEMPPNVVLPAACSLLFHHQLQMDFNRPFTTMTPLWAERGKTNGTHTG